MVVILHVKTRVSSGGVNATCGGVNDTRGGVLDVNMFACFGQSASAFSDFSCVPG